MRIAIDADALVAAFSGQNFDLESVVRPSILAVTSSIVDDYSRKIFEDGSGLGKEWLTRLLSNPERLRIVLDEELEFYEIANSNLDFSDYVGAAFLHGHQLITSSKEPSLLAKAKDYGVQIRDAQSSIEPHSLPGYFTVFNLLLSSKTRYKHAAIRHFFAKEKNVVIYDRYIKPSSLCFLEQVLMSAHSLTSVTVISDFDRGGSSIVTAGDVRKVLEKVKPQASINCYYPDLKKLDDKHDRHIHLGDRLQISFSSGIDCFGLPPDFNNSECQIDVRYLSRQSPLRSYYVTAGPADKRGFTIDVRSKI